ncbi:uncharacterized protein LOC133174167 [Saccostrea echinata]|uniref:uncharacterized protein LOC133174167 n=1 Tax=Saccostrea echinata TaxID=191078 RepID=UPI002A83297D|nr:uncharacterized protein LOC133174167 [Saccostrea echinata]XP_061165215.1 uncharacterized protein LOC133174167 [Saccostrea echinata]
MANQPPLVILFLIGAVFILFVTTPLIKKSLDLWNDHENQCSIYNRLLKLKVNPPEDCPYNEVKDLAFELMLMGIIFLSLVTFFLGFMWVFITCLPKHRRKEIGILSGFFACAVVVLAVFMAMNYKDLHAFVYKDNKMNWTSLHSNMNSSLLKNFVSDNIISANETSNRWNIFFTENKCCGVNSVYGTTNDFDTTPWCTTAGSCQQTNSQIPKSCCVGVTKENFQLADIKCHAQVSPQTYNDKGCYLVIKEKITEERIKHNSNIKQVLNEEMNVLMAMGVCIIMPVFGIVAICCGLIKNCCKSKTQENDEYKKESNWTEKANTETNQTKM